MTIKNTTTTINTTTSANASIAESNVISIAPTIKERVLPPVAKLNKMPQEAVADIVNSFFGSYVDTDTADKLKREMNKLASQLSVLTVQYTEELTKRYNSKFVPINGDYYLEYTGSTNTYCFKFTDGTLFQPAIEEGNYIKVYLDKKSSEIDIVVGYCYEVGAAVVRSYKVVVNSTNTKASIRPLGEKLLPLVQPFPVNVLCYSNLKESTNNTWHRLDNGLGRVPAKQFVEEFYGIENFNVSMTLAQFEATRKLNACFETIIRSDEADDVKTALLSIQCGKAKSIPALIGCEKKIWKEAGARNLKCEFVAFKTFLKRKYGPEANDWRSEERKKAFAASGLSNKTDSEWLDFLDKCRDWSEHLDFYDIQYKIYGDSLPGVLVQMYCGAEPYSQSRYIHEYYPFGKWCNYMINETVNQGFSSLRDCNQMLGDYIRMCRDLNVVPTLYSSYIKQTHDITSRNHKIKMTQEQEEIFKSRYADFKQYIGSEYRVIAPTCTHDIQAEGDALNHCVASYIKRVLNDDCRIVFLRTNNEPDKSLVTVEIRDNTIVQARGLHNRSVTNEEKAVLTRFCELREMKYRA